MKKPQHLRLKDARVKAEALWRFVTAKEQGTLEHTHGIAFKAGNRSCNTGFRVSGDFKGVTHRFSMHPGKDFATSSPDKVLTSKQRQSKYRLQDGELYDNSGFDRSKVDNRSMVRVGTIPEHFVPITDKDTGETRVVKVRAKGKYQEVGLQGNTPKDGGK